jgi:hypothetical protein
MWEAYGLKNEDFLWAGMTLWGGFGGQQQQGTCGAMAGSAVFLGLKHRTPLKDKEKVAAAKKSASAEAGGLAKSFFQKFGAVSCSDLTGVDFSDPIATKQAIEGGLFARVCDKLVEFVIDKMYEMDKNPAISLNRSGD